MHLDPIRSHPGVVQELREAAGEGGDSSEKKVEEWALDEDEIVVEEKGEEEWKGIRKDVGIFYEDQWAFIMSKCLRSMGSLFPLFRRGYKTNCWWQSSRRSTSRRRTKLSNRRSRCLRFRRFRSSCYRSSIINEETRRETRKLRHPNRLFHG